MPILQRNLHQSCCLLKDTYTNYLINQCCDLREHAHYHRFPTINFFPMSEPEPTLCCLLPVQILVQTDTSDAKEPS